MIISRFIPLVMVVFALLFGGTAALTAPTGGSSTYLPLTYRGNAHTLPEGNLILYVTEDSQNHNFFLSPPPLTSTTAFPLTSDDSVNLESNARFSPDGNYIAFRSYASSETIGGLEIMGTQGLPRFMVFPVAPGRSIRNRGWSPDSQYLAFSVTENSRTALYVFNTGTRTSTLVAEAILTFHWDKTEPRSFYGVQNSDGQTIDLIRANADGSNATVLLPSVPSLLIWGTLSDGHLVARIASENDDNLWLINPENGQLTRLTNDQVFERSVSISPVGDKIFFARGEGNLDAEEIFIINRSGILIWHYDFNCGDSDCMPYYWAWAPDGNELAFSWRNELANGLTNYLLYIVAADGSQPVPTQIVEDDARDLGYSPDGRYLAYQYRGIQVLDRQSQTTSPISADGVPIFFLGWRPLP